MVHGLLILKVTRFRAANGSKVNIDGSTNVSVWVGFKKKKDNLGRFPVYRQAKVEVLGWWASATTSFQPTLSVSADGNSIRIQKVPRLLTVRQV